MAHYVHVPVKIPASVMGDLKKFGALFDVTGEVAQFGQSMLEQLWQKREGTPFHSDLEATTYVLYGKGFKTFHAARILQLTGCGADVLALSGSLFENLVDLMYIRQAPTRATRYLHYELIEKYDQMGKVLKRKRLPRGMRKNYRLRQAKLKPQVQRLRQRFPEQSCWVKLRRKGDKVNRRMNLRDRAEAVKLGVEYDTQYHILCSYKHTRSAAASGFMLMQGQSVDVIVGPSIKGVYNAAVHSTKYFLGLCGVFQDVCRLGKEAAVKALVKKLDETGHRVLVTHPNLCD